MGLHSPDISAWVSETVLWDGVGSATCLGPVALEKTVTLVGSYRPGLGDAGSFSSLKKRRCHTGTCALGVCVFLLLRRAMGMCWRVGGCLRLSWDSLQVAASGGLGCGPGPATFTFTCEV